MTDVCFKTTETCKYLTRRGLGGLNEAVMFKMVHDPAEGLYFKYGDAYLGIDWNGNACLGDLPNKFFLRNGRYETGAFFLALSDGEMNENRPSLFPLVFNPCIYRGPDIKGNIEVHVLTDHEKFLRDGFVVLKGSSTNEELRLAREELLKSKHTRVSELFALHSCYADFLRDPVLVDLLSKIYTGKPFHLTTYSSNTLHKCRSETFWHVDYPYHDIAGVYPDTILGVQVIYALNDFTAENGATMYIPQSFNSHAFPLPEHINSRRDQIKQMTMPKGSILVYRGDLWHSQGINTTDEPRAALLANFSPLDIPAKGNFASQIPLNETLFGIKNVNGKIFIQ